MLVAARLRTFAAVKIKSSPVPGCARAGLGCDAILFGFEGIFTGTVDNFFIEVPLTIRSPVLGEHARSDVPNRASGGCAGFRPIRDFMVLHITNIDSADDICSIRHELEVRGFTLEWYDIGSAKIEGQISDAELTELTQALAIQGFGVLRNPKELLVEQVKQIIQEMIHCAKHTELHHITGVLAARTNYNYRYLSRVFSLTEKTTIEHYIILQKVERVKALLAAESRGAAEGTHSLSQIAFELNYSSVAHLSAQFKSIAGETIRQFRAKLGHALHDHATHDRARHGHPAHTLHARRGRQHAVAHGFAMLQPAESADVVDAA